MSTISSKVKCQPNDAELSQSITHSLVTSGHMPLNNIEVSVHEGFVTLKGHVPTYFLKQMAQNIVMLQQGVELLCNDIEVQ